MQITKGKETLGKYDKDNFQPSIEEFSISVINSHF